MEEGGLEMNRFVMVGISDLDLIFAQLNSNTTLFVTHDRE